MGQQGVWRSSMFKASLLLGLLVSQVTAEETGLARLRFSVSDVNGQPLPSRIHLMDAEGEPIEPSGYPFWNDHFVSGGEATLELGPGTYRWEVEHGPEFESESGTIHLKSDQKSEVKVTLERFADMRAAGWYCADLHIHRPEPQMELLMRAEGLDYAPVIQWWNTPSRSYIVERPIDRILEDGRLITVNVGEDEREGGALLYFGLKQPLNLTVESREIPSPMKFVNEALSRPEEIWIDIEKPFWWDVPVWLASGKMDSIGIANNHMCRSTVLGNEAWGKPRDLEMFPGPHGNGLWAQHIYYQILNAGIAIPPSAGSASGVLPNPVGYNRIYVKLDDAELTRENFFETLSSGKVFVTNGPLLQVTANAKSPGHHFTSEMVGQSIPLTIDVSSRDRLKQVELIFNGEVVERLSCTSDLHQQLRTKLHVSEPGWFLVRAIADVDATFRFASTAPWYVSDGRGELPVSRSASQFFLNWVNERILRVRENVSNPVQREAVLGPHIDAREFWSSRLENATAE